jgi:hypothetical protein
MAALAGRHSFFTLSKDHLAVPGLDHVFLTDISAVTLSSKLSNDVERCVKSLRSPRHLKEQNYDQVLYGSCGFAFHLARSFCNRARCCFRCIARVLRRTGCMLRTSDGLLRRLICYRVTVSGIRYNLAMSASHNIADDSCSFLNYRNQTFVQPVNKRQVTMEEYLGSNVWNVVGSGHI